MRDWFARQPVHRKLVIMAWAVSTAAVAAAIIGLVVLDVQRYRNAAVADTRALARVLAENTAAAAVFGDQAIATDTLASVRVRPAVLLACVYEADGTLLARYARESGVACPAVPADSRTWRAVAAAVPITHGDRRVGTVYVRRGLSDLTARITVTAAAGLIMLLVAGILALALAERLQRTISRPIAALAAAARAIGQEKNYSLPKIEAPPDEIGDLVRAFEGMMTRLGTANADILESNAALRREIEERGRIEAERENLLVREREASRLKDEFLASVSHELRTPLNAILGWTQILSSTPPSEKTLAKATASLARNALAQNRVIEDLIDVSRIVTGKLRLTIEPVDLRSVVEAAVDVVGPAARARHLRLDVTMPAEPCVIEGDYDRLRQVLWNLLSNAIKFTASGGSVQVTLASGAEACTIEVTDTGVGIPPSFLPHVFERFRQADGSMTREHGGLGIGLAIVKELVDMHGGSVTARSAGTGMGATFEVRLPHFVERGERGEAAAPLDVPRLDGIRAMALDEDPDSRDKVTSALTGAGASVRIASSGAELVERWAREKPDVLICDIGMAQMDGFEILDRVRRIDRELGREETPAVAVVADGSEASGERAREAGFEAQIARPLDRPAIVRVIASIVEKT
jgi:signal transduction histidine kinase/CheY-like chemotaxis protein